MKLTPKINTLEGYQALTPAAKEGGILWQPILYAHKNQLRKTIKNFKLTKSLS